MAYLKADLITKLESFGFYEHEVVLTFDEFFTNNECESSIGVNIYPIKPTISEFRNTFNKLIDDKIVDKVFVRVVDIEDPEEWFFSDGIYVVGILSIELLEERIKNLHPDSIIEGWEHGEPINVGEYDKTKNVFTIFWD